jgi:hypothetical protein
LVKGIKVSKKDFKNQHNDIKIAKRLLIYSFGGFLLTFMVHFMAYYEFIMAFMAVKP